MKNTDKKTFLSFSIFNEMFLIPVINVLEVLQKTKISKVPNSPTNVKGVLNFRGEIVPIYEMRAKFGFPERNPDEKYVIVIIQMELEKGRKIIGAITDTVKDVISVKETDIKPVPQMNKEFNTDFLDGIIRLEETHMMLLNVFKVFLT